MSPPAAWGASLQNRAVGGLLTKLAIASAQGDAQFAFEAMEVVDSAAHIGQLLRQMPTHGPAGLRAVGLQLEKRANLAQSEAERLKAPNEGERLEIVFAVAAEASLRSRDGRQQRIALVEAYRVYADPNAARQYANLHRCAPKSG
ncbi:MAG TPA: hypothetical protein VMF66_14865 [Candidatus Acidoferrum sp.]|nr:hypothetical protein [Candidatus Acidoferrum sp.]